MSGGVSADRSCPRQAVSTHRNRTPASAHPHPPPPDTISLFRFCTLDELKTMELAGALVGNVVDVVLRVEKFVQRGLINLDFDLVELHDE